MKGLILILIVVAVVYFGFVNTANKTLIYNNEEYKISRTEGKDSYHKYHYTKTGRDTGLNDFVEILKFDKPEASAEDAKKTRAFIKKIYNAKYIAGTSGQFGSFGPNNNNYAYMINSETSDAYWFFNYVIQSKSISSSEAKSRSTEYINHLEKMSVEVIN